jgi:tagatose 6-phosphate kinase
MPEERGASPQTHATPLIVTAGLTPAWQRIGVLDRLVLGEVNRLKEVYPCASGKPVNAGLALHHLGARATTVIPLGGATGDLVEAELRELGMSYRRIDAAGLTRVCSTYVDRSSASPTEVVEDAEPLSAAEVEAFAAAYRATVVSADVVVLTGSMPRGSQPELYRDLIAGSPCPVILDARGPELLMALESSPLIVKPNRPELAQTLGRDLQTDGALVNAMEELVRRGARWVVVSDGPAPLFVVGESRRYRVHPPAVRVANPIASGDCLAAGLAWALAGGLTMTKALCLGVAAATANAMHLLPGRLDRTLVESMALDVRLDEA